MSCRLPGADGLDAFWRLVESGGVAWGPLPESRLPRDLYFDPRKGQLGRSYSEMGALVSERQPDPRTCPITEEMRDRYDIAHLVFLEVTAQACRDAGLDPFAMPADRRTGVYVGHTGGSTRIGDIVYGTGIDETATLLGDVDVARRLLGPDVAAVAAEVTAAIRDRYPGRLPGERLDLEALGAARIVQEALRLDGPYLVVDAACASSLQALAIAARSLATGGIDQAIVGGASYCKSDSLVLFSAAQSVSNTGSCPFGRDADGLVTAEGYVALVLKTLSRAQADGDRIRAVIRGIGVASDGKGKSLWAPRREGQMLAVERAYPDPAEMSHIDYIEAHATSTQVGDATELGALASLLGKHLPAGRRIPIGSVKANIGHTLETAGLASLVKVVLAMEHGVIPPGSTCRELNEEFCWDEGPFSVPRESLPWPRRADGGPRCAAVNAFGIGGLNVHLALAESAPARAPSVVRPTPAGDDGAIAIVGIGCVLPGALSVAAFGELLDRGVPALADVPADRWNLRRALDPSGPRPWRTVAGRGGFVIGFQYDWRRHKVPPKQIAAANPLQFMLLEAADAAIADLGGPARLDRARTAVVVGTMFGGEFSNDLQMGLRLPETAVHLRAALHRRGLDPRQVEEIVAAYDKKVLEELPALVDETGSFTSSTLASRLTKSFDLMGGALALDAGDCSALAAIAAAADMLHQGTCDAVVCAAGQRAMDLMAFEGLSLEGALTAEPAAPFNAAGGRIPAEGAVVLVLKSLAAARAAGDPIRAVIRGVRVGSGAALEEVAPRVVHDAAAAARVPASAIGVVEMSGSGAAAIDGVVAAALAAEYGNAGGPPARSAGSLDGLVGHCGAGAGAAAVVKLARSLASGTLPATPGIAGEVTVAPGIVASSAPRAIPAADAAGYRAATVTTVHAPLVGHLVIDNGLPVPTGATVASAAPVAQARPIAAPAPGGRALVAAIFPGQGSQYGDMFRSLATETADGSAVRDELDGMARRVGLPTLAETAWRADHVLGLDILATQWAMYLGDLCAWRVLDRLGFAPDIVASHSFGEFPALAAVGAWSVDDGARATRARADAVAQHGPRGGAMLSVIADRATVGDLIAPLAGSVWVCAENAPEQIVVGGTVAGVDALEARLQPTRIRSKRLAVPSPFHTPLLAAAADRLAGALAPVAFATPRLPLVSSTTVEPLDDAAAIRASLVRQMTERVRWVDVVRRLHAAGVRTFVEVGPSGVLTGLVRRILDGLPGVTLVQFDQRGQSGADHLRRLRDQLSAAGALRTVATAVAVPSAVRAVATHPAILSFDATARRRDRNRAGGGGPSFVPAGTAPAPTAPIAVLANGHAADAPGSPRDPSPAPSGRHGGNSGTARNGSHDGGNSAAAAPLAPASYVAIGSAVSNGSAYPSSGNGYHAAGAVVDASAKAAPVRLRNAAAGDSPIVRPVGGLEQIVVALLTEHAARLPLASAGTAGSDVLDALEHLFEAVPSRRAAVMAATTLDDFCALLAASGGKAEWVEPAPPVIARAGAAKPSAQGDGLETFVIDFVVEQTGYPREIVELDADLEGDLGIDSIRKAQLFGEIGHRYGLGVDSSVSLDDFRTLRHLLDYMLPRVGGAAVAAAAPPQAAPAPAARALSAAPAASSAAAAPVAAASAQGAGVELETFVIDFVVEQTGYPREIVELDADLEGDLGIDSIRKAQLFGEIGQRYGLGADASVSLDDFRTLRHLLDYMLPRVGGGAVAAAAPPQAAPAPAARALSAAPAASSAAAAPVAAASAQVAGVEL
ncbi:MAG: beta-ketoacyl synthase N-terminal-like domain-containing protein, partial [Planctomycetota bacterium]